MKKLIILCLSTFFCISLNAQVKCSGGLFFKLEHKATRLNGSRAAVDFILTNKTGEDIDINFLTNNSTITDNLGRTYSGRNLQFDFANTGYDNGMIPEKTSVKLRCIIYGLDERVKSLPIMLMKYKCSISNGDEWILMARKVKFE